ncbi:MAG: hypothetical protein DCC56_13670 [Anaerolineae bacterium]|nr:MAG: hypothetical protein DCC56_13670 [Anaerolineae bacterium]
MEVGDHRFQRYYPPNEKKLQKMTALGQTLGGPIVAVIAATGSTIASLVTLSLLLTPRAVLRQPR